MIHSTCLLTCQTTHFIFEDKFFILIFVGLDAVIIIITINYNNASGFIVIFSTTINLTTARAAGVVCARSKIQMDAVPNMPRKDVLETEIGRPQCTMGTDLLSPPPRPK